MSGTFQSHIEKRFQGEGKRIKIEKMIRLRWHHIEDWIADSDIKVRMTFWYLCITFSTSFRCSDNTLGAGPPSNVVLHAQDIKLIHEVQRTP